MYEDKTHITVTPANDELTITHREGKAAEIVDPQPVTIEGTIHAPAEFFLKRDAADKIDRNKAYLEVSPSAPGMRLYFDPSDPLAPVISGRMKVNPRLAELDINNYGRRKFDESSFIVKLKEARALFEDQTECLRLVDTINNLQIKVEQRLERRDDERANRKVVFDQIAESELPYGFTLRTNVFSGSTNEQGEQSFTVDLKYHYQDGALYFWLESSDLQELMDIETQHSLEMEVSKFDGKIPVIYV